MSYEEEKGIDLIASTDIQAELTLVDQFVHEVDLKRDLILCGDDRPAEGVPRPYIHMFGAGANLSFNTAVMREATKPGSVTESLEKLVMSDVPILKKFGYNIGIHSDDTKEHGLIIDLSLHGCPVGCAYCEARSTISRLIVHNEPDVKRSLEGYRPELFSDESGHQAFSALVDAHDRLSNRPGFLRSGREVVLSAIKAGAKGVVVRGPHVSKTAIYNLEPSKSLDTVSAMNNQTPYYFHDGWATATIRKDLAYLYPYDAKLAAMADLLDFEGTRRALGVEAVMRRPSAA